MSEVTVRSAAVGINGICVAGVEVTLWSRGLRKASEIQMQPVKSNVQQAEGKEKTMMMKLILRMGVGGAAWLQKGTILL